MNIEIADIADAPELQRLQKAAFQIEAERYNDFTIRPLVETLEEYTVSFSTHTFFLMRDRGEIVGSVSVQQDEDTVYIGRLVVLPARQGEGIASRLLAKAESFFSGVKRSELFTGHRSEKNLSIYMRRGYREFKREVISTGLTFIYMEKENI